MKLTAADRKRIPGSEYGEPGQRKYPMPDREHAGLAKGYAKKQYAKGSLSLGELNRITSKANRKLKSY